MTWPHDTDRPDALLAAARIMDERQETIDQQRSLINQQVERIFQLEDQVTRLQRVALLEWEAYYNIGLHHQEMPDAEARRYADSVTGLRSTDLDPIEQGHGDHS